MVKGVQNCSAVTKGPQAKEPQASLEKHPRIPQMNSQGYARPGGDITTLLDLTPRDFQDNEYTPLGSEKTWWLPDEARRIHPLSLSVQQFQFRGPTSFGQRFTFDIGSVSAGDLLFSTMLQIELGHWLDETTLLRFQARTCDYPKYQGKYINDVWFYANSLGTVIIEKAELEIADQTIEIVDGDFLNTAGILMLDVNGQYGVAIDGLGRYPISTLLTSPTYHPYPTQDNTLIIPLPFFFQRVKLQEALPLLACREGTVRIHVTLRPFSECIRLLAGRRKNILQTPLNQEIQVINFGAIPAYVQTPIAAPPFKNIQLVTYSAHTDGLIRQRILRNPFEIITRICNTFYFSEPLKYVTNKTSSDIIQVQLPLEVNHPMEEIIWFVRRKATANNNEWTNYSAVTSVEYNPIYNPFRPLLQHAVLQLNGVELINQEEQWFRQHIALAHKGGASAYDSFIYGYSFAKNPAEHQPSGTANASRLQSVRLTLDVSPPGGIYEQEWEVKVFVITLQWLRFQNGLANQMYAD